MSDRGMKKWVPYKSLVEHDEELKKWRINREKISRPILMEDKIEEINNFLTNYDGSECLLSYFYDGNIIQEKGIIKRIDLYSQSLKINDSTINIKDITDIEKI